ncbi:CDP-alcohol phosphatidyltransferase family protein [Sulfuriflexus mobilis]|uniref:CDP-alcohol phosphatidyltransferase family protein n=1 Tax=Sulfuriflexus mobilis TaxID=1811807 RepID=UPI000F84D33E|nr:CDP-alcohol phosphatidyltransferase family protein [Sulfuriflexus mobilis]
MNKKDFLSPPNIVSLVRIVMSPVLLWLAWHQEPFLYMLALLFTLFTDVLDGFLARTLNQVTKLGARLDSWGDFIIYTTLVVAAWWLWPEIIIEEIIAVLAIIISFAIPVAIGLIKFRTLTSYHTWAVKIAVFITIVSYVVTFMDWARWPIYVAATVAVLAAIEEIAITLVMRHEHADVRSIWHALKYYRDN